MNSVRPKLLESYRRTAGRARTRGTGKERESSENALLSSITRKPSQREVERFLTNGIANIKLEVNYANVEFVIDLDLLSQVRIPLSAWLSNQKPGELSLTVSDGRQAPKTNAETFDPARGLEGIRIVLVPKSRQQIPAPYEASITPLYLDN